jgi:hypothetical protein
MPFALISHQVSLLVSRYQQIPDHFYMDLIARHQNLIILTILKHHLSALAYYCVFSYHGIGLTRPSLAIREYANIKPIYKRLDQALNLLKNIILTLLVSKHSVKFKLLVTKSDFSNLIHFVIAIFYQCLYLRILIFFGLFQLHDFLF